MKKFAIAVDGPAGSGKSTVAKAVAKELGIIYVDTGAMYRAVAYHCMENGVSTLDEEKVVALMAEMKLEIEPQEGGQKILLNGEDITSTIRTQAIGQAASEVGTIQAVRQKLGDMQREMATTSALIMDGRDIGTYVLPNAEVKIYLDAGVPERAKRRVGELQEKGECPVLETVQNEILQRDENDMNRKHSPLRKAEDAIYLDSTSMVVEDVVREILKIVKQTVGEV